MFSTWMNVYLQCFDDVCWVTGRASGLEKTQWWGAGVVVCLGQGAYLHMAQLMPLPLTISCSSKSRLVLSFWYQLTWVLPNKRPLNGCCWMQMNDNRGSTGRCSFDCWWQPSYLWAVVCDIELNKHSLVVGIVRPPHGPSCLLTITTHHSMSVVLIKHCVRTKVTYVLLVILPNSHTNSTLTLWTCRLACPSCLLNDT